MERQLEWVFSWRCLGLDSPLGLPGCLELGSLCVDIADSVCYSGLIVHFMLDVANLACISRTRSYPLQHRLELLNLSVNNPSEIQKLKVII